MKTVLFVPGFKEKLATRNYQSTIKAIESQGYKVKFVPINWWRTTIQDWIQELEEVYNAYSPKNTVLAGFSYGAMVALMAASKRNPQELWLFSLSAYFKEDIPSLKKSWLTYIGKRRTRVFSELTFEEFAKQIKCKTLIFIGEKEATKYPRLDIRAQEAKSQIKNSKLILVANSDHDITEENYLKAIRESI